MANIISFTKSSGVNPSINLSVPTGVQNNNYLLVILRSTHSGYAPSETGWNIIGQELDVRGRSGIYRGGGIIYHRLVTDTGILPTGYNFSHSGTRFCGLLFGINSTGLTRYYHETGVNTRNYSVTPTGYTESGVMALRIVGSETILVGAQYEAFSGAYPNEYFSGIGLSMNVQQTVNSGNIGTAYIGLASSGSVLPAKKYSFSSTQIWG